MEITVEIRVADECWVALALLHRQRPERESFSPREVLDLVKEERAGPELRAGVQPHIYLHNVANIPPNSAKYRMFYRLGNGTLRLFRPGDDFDAARSGKTKPQGSELPSAYQSLLRWYEDEYCKPRPAGNVIDPVLQMRGIGKEVWADEGADAFVARERDGWVEREHGGHEPTSYRLAQRVWSRIVQNQGQEFRTRSGLPFTYKIEGNTGIWFYREGKRINKRLSRGDLEKALSRCPLADTTEISDCFDPAYLFGLLTDARIRETDW